MTEFYGQMQIANAMGISPSGAKQLVDGGSLPPPDAMVGDRPLWAKETFDVWFCGYAAGIRSHGKRGRSAEAVSR